MNKFIKPEFDTEINPVDWFNMYQFQSCIDLMREKLGMLQSKDSNIWNIGDAKCIFDGHYFIFNGEVKGFSINKPYTPFMVYVKLSFDGNSESAILNISYSKMGKKIPYVRVGVDYFKKIVKVDRFGIERLELVRWKKDELKDDFGRKNILKFIDKFDSFILEPDNKNYQQIIGTNYNVYSEFSHKPEQGDWTWSKRIIEHIFGEHYELGLRYLQILYLYPKQILPILVLASTERHTGKSTFLDWLNIFFGANMVVINPADITSQFNSAYAKANVIGIEETVTDKSSTVEKLKALSTQKYLNMNQKFVDNYKLPFFGKFIITTNDERKFMKIDTDEIRFWVRKVGIPKFKNTQILDNLIKEIPAFIHYLETLPPPDFSINRMAFTPEEIQTESLLSVKENSHSWLYKEIFEVIENYFNQDASVLLFFATPKDIKDYFFAANNRVEINYIRTVLKDEFRFKPSDKPIYYQPIDGNPFQKVVGRCFTFERSFFTDSEIGDSYENDVF